MQVELEDTFMAQNTQARAYKAARKYFYNGRSSKYYFRLPGRKYDHIKQIRNNAGRILTDSADILHESARFYEKLYTKPPHIRANDSTLCAKFLSNIPDYKMSFEYFQMLDKPITLTELYTALSSMKLDKSPGEDGLTVEFYRTFWPQIGDLVFKSIQNAYLSGTLSHSQRRGILRLLPKHEKDLLQVRNWRPITLLNVDYKLLSKALALRLQDILPDLVDTDQRGFVKNRYIGDNIMEIYSVIAQAEENQDTASLLLLDIEKAFDSVSWTYLRKVLDYYSFPDSYIRWVEVLYHGKEIRVLNNGHVSGAIRPTRSLAQGCGLSPILFVLVIETLALAIRSNINIQGIACGKVQKKLGLLADDVIVAVQHNEITLETLLHVLHDFAIVSNLGINQEKSLLVPIGRTPLRRERFECIQGFKFNTEPTFNYLGTPIPIQTEMSRQMRAVIEGKYLSLNTYITSQLAPRSGIQHTLLGRILNVKAFIGSKMQYVFSMTPSPTKNTYQRLQQLLNNYIWSNGSHDLIANLLYQPWDAGGFQMYSCKFQDHSLKLKWMNKLLLDNQQFWQLQIAGCFSIPINRVAQYNGPYHMMNFLIRLDAMLPEFWKDVLKHWCKYSCSKNPESPGEKLLFANLGIQSRYVEDPTIIQRYINRDIYTVSEFLEFQRTCPPGLAEHLHVRGILAGIPASWKRNLRPNTQNVHIQWNLDFTKTLSMAEIHRGIVNYENFEPQRVWNSWQNALNIQDVKLFWKGIVRKRLHHTEIKMRGFYVRYIYGCFWLNTRLAASHRRASPNCTFCDRAPETRVHFFWDCPKVQPLWHDFIQFCQMHVDPTADYCRNNCLLFGFEKPVLNCMVTHLKYHIYNARLYKLELSIRMVIKKIFSTRNKELMASKHIPHLQRKKTRQYWGELVSNIPFQSYID